MSEEQPVNPWRRRLYYAGMTLGLLLFLWQLASAIASLRSRAVVFVAPVWLIAALGLVVTGYLLQLGGWLLVMRCLRCTLTVSNTFSGYYLSFLPRYIPGTVWGYLSRSEWLSRQHGIFYRKSSIGSLLEAGSFVATALSIGALAYLNAPWQIPAVAVLALAGVVAWPLLAYAANATISGLQWLLIPTAYLVYFCYWVVQGLSLAAICRALDVGQSTDFFHLVAASAVGWSAGFLTVFIPAGFGVRELSLTYLLTTQSGMAVADANLVAVLSRVSMIVSELLMLATAIMWRNYAATQPVPGP
jgi:hypothetical protein